MVGGGVYSKVVRAAFGFPLLPAEGGVVYSKMVGAAYDSPLPRGGEGVAMKKFTMITPMVLCSR